MDSTPAPELIIFPTSEPNPETGELTPIGKARLASLARYARSLDRPYLIGIVGGYRTEGVAEAVRFANAIYTDYPDLWEHVAWTSASSYFSAHDFVAIADYLREYPGRLSLLSHPDHIRRINLTLHKLKIYNAWRINSDEPASYGRVTELILRFVTILDPLWTKWPTALLRKLALRRVQGA